MGFRCTHAEQLTIVSRYHGSKTEEPWSLFKLAVYHKKSTRTIRAILLAHDEPLRPSSQFGSQGYVPTLEQIEAAKEEVQETWSDKVRNDRAVQKKETVTITRCRVSDYSCGGDARLKQ